MGCGGNLVKDYEKIISDIITALRTPGEEKTDGECLEEVTGILERNGYEVFPEGWVS